MLPENHLTSGRLRTLHLYNIIYIYIYITHPLYESLINYLSYFRVVLCIVLYRTCTQQQTIRLENEGRRWHKREGASGVGKGPALDGDRRDGRRSSPSNPAHKVIRTHARRWRPWETRVYKICNVVAAVSSVCQTDDTVKF